MAKDKTKIVGLYGVEEGEVEQHFQILKKEEVQVPEVWHGYFMRNEKKIKLSFENFTCPPEGGEITGYTIEG